MTSTSVTGTPSREQRFDRGARLTMAAVAILLLWPITLSLLFTTYPTDGWASTTEAGFFNGPRVLWGAIQSAVQSWSAQPLSPQTLIPPAFMVGGNRAPRAA